MLKKIDPDSEDIQTEAISGWLATAAANRDLNKVFIDEPRICNPLDTISKYSQNTNGETKNKRPFTVELLHIIDGT